MSSAQKYEEKGIYDWGKLEIPEDKKKYLAEVKNKYKVLATETDTKLSKDSAETQW